MPLLNPIITVRVEVYDRNTLKVRHRTFHIKRGSTRLSLREYLRSKLPKHFEILEYYQI